MRYLLTIFSFLLIGLMSLNAQFNGSKGAKQAGMGGTNLLVSDVWSNFNNQAGLAKTEGISAGVYFNNKFNLSELGDKAAAFSYKTDKFGVAGLNYSYFGNSSYNISNIGLAYGKQLGKRFYAGLRVNYLTNYIIGDYGKKSILYGDFGILSQLNDKMLMAAYISNPWRSKLTETAPIEYTPTVFKLALGYYFTDEVFFTVQGEKDIDESGVIVRSGVDYKLIAGLSLRTGVAFSQDYTEYSFGAGYNWKSIDLDFAFSNHPYLGFSPHVSLAYNIKQAPKPE